MPEFRADLPGRNRDESRAQRWKSYHYPMIPIIIIIIIPSLSSSSAAAAAARPVSKLAASGLKDIWSGFNPLSEAWTRSGKGRSLWS